MKQSGSVARSAFPGVPQVPVECPLQIPGYHLLTSSMTRQVAFRCKPNSAAIPFVAPSEIGLSGAETQLQSSGRAQ